MKQISLKKIVFFTLLSVFLSVIPPKVFAEDKEKSQEDIDIEKLSSMSLEEIMNIQVYSASKRPEKLSQTASAAFVLTAKDIEKAGATSIPESLRLVPGVQVARINSNNWAVSIRGFNRQYSNKLLVMVDGRTVYTPLFSGVYWDSLDYLLDDIDRIEVIRGPGGTLWGANAVNGVINIITKEARKTQGNLATVTTGLHEHGITEYRYGGSVDETNYYRVYGKFRKISEFKTAGADRSSEDDWMTGQTGFRYDFRDYDYDKVTLQADYYHGRREGDMQIPNASFVNPTIPADFTEDTNNANIMLKWNKPISDVHTELLAYIDYQHRDSLPLLEQEVVTYNVDYQANYDTERHTITGGLGYRLVTDNLDNNNLISYNPPDTSFAIYSAFLQDKISIIEDKLFFTLGSKFSYNDYTDFEFQPNARLLWQVNENHSIWAAASRSVRIPSRTEDNVNLLAVQGVPLGLAFITGNQSYGSEKLHAYEIGYRGDITNNLYLDVTAFYNDYRDLRTTEAISGTVRTSFNNGYGETYGFEAYAVAGVTKDLEVRAGYTFLSQNFHTRGLNSNTALENDEERSPNIMYNLNASYKISDKVTWNNYLYYVSDLAYYNVTSTVRYSIPDYTRFDTVFNIKATENIDINIFGRNLFDNYHQEFDELIYSNPSEIPRTFGIQTKIRF